MKKILLILFVLIGSITYGQTVFTQTFVDRCTGNVTIVTANFVQGSATVAFYSKVRTFTYQQFLSGELTQWLNETYTWWDTLSPCSTATQQAQQAQQTAQTAQQAAQTASTAASTASTAASTASTAGSTTSTPPPTESSGSTETTGGGETTESKTEETKTEETKTEEKTEETKTEESSEEGGEESSEEKSEEKKEEEKKEEKKKEEEKKKKIKSMAPIQLKADMMAMQTMLGSYDGVISIGASQTSLFGDTTYGLNGMVWSNLRQFSLNGSYTKINMVTPNVLSIVHDGHTHYGTDNFVSTKSPLTPPRPYVGSIDAFSLGYSNNFGNESIVLSANKLKPMGKWGTVGVGVSMVNLFGEGKYQMTMLGYNLLYTNMVMVSPRIQYTPAFIWTQSPYMGKFDLQNQLKGTQIDGMVILANSFTVRLTRRFTFNVGWTLIKSTNKDMPSMNSFMIGSKLPF